MLATYYDTHRIEGQVFPACAILHRRRLLPLRRRGLRSCTPGFFIASMALVVADRLGSPRSFPQEDTPLQHKRSPGSTRSLLRGLLAATTVGLPRTSRRQLCGAHRWVLGGFPLGNQVPKPPAKQRLPLLFPPFLDGGIVKEWQDALSICVN